MRRYVIPVIALALALCNPVLASVGKNSGEVGLGFGITEFDSNTFNEAGIGYGIRGGYHINKLFEVEGQLSQTSATDKDPVLGDLELTATSMFVNGVFNFHPRPTIVPYALVGLGNTSVEYKDTTGSVDDNSTALQIGGGSRFFFGQEKKVALRVEVALINESTFDQDSTHTNIVGGLTWNLGKN